VISFSFNKPIIAIHLRHPSVACWQMTAAQAAKLAALLPEYDVRLCENSGDFQALLPQARIAITWNFRQEWLASAQSLQVISTPAAGKDFFTLQLPPHIQSWNGRFHGQIIGETAVGALLAMCRGLFAANLNMASKSWPRAEISPLQTTLRGSRVVILGFGRIGQCIGKMLKPFGVQITGIGRSLHPPPDWFTAGDQVFDSSGLDSSLAEADHLILCLPRSPETDLLLDQRRLALLPAQATVSNYGRGNAIDIDALLNALHQQRLRGAFLDVFPEEPLPENSPLLACPNLWRLPHLSAVAADYLDLYIDDFISQLKDLEKASASSRA
jgi:D-2-hydroxyacid dehydrogenase (NADP+)